MPGICDSFQSTYSVSGVPSQMLFGFNPATIPGNDETTLTLRAGTTLPPGAYPISVTKTVAYGRPPATETLTIQVLCNVRLKTCQQPVPASARYTCFADLEPILETATGIFAKRRPADNTSSDIVYMSRMSDGTCPLPPPELAKSSLTITQLAQPTVALTNSAISSYGTLTWTVSGASSTFASVAFSSLTTTGAPNANVLSFTAPAGTTAGTYPIQITATSQSGLSASATLNVTVLPPMWYEADVNTDGYCTPGVAYSYQAVPIGLNYNTHAPSLGAASVQDCPNGPAVIDGLFLCSGPVTKVVPASGHAEFYYLTITYIGELGDLFEYEPFQHANRLPINDRGVAYPKIDASYLGYPYGVIPFPVFSETSVSGSLQDCPDLRYLHAPGCVARATAADHLRELLAQVYEPPNYGDGRGYTPHHIQPVCWGGNNLAINGVFLLTDGSDPNNYHAQYSTWWKPRNFTPDGTRYPPPPLEDGDC